MGTISWILQLYSLFIYIYIWLQFKIVIPIPKYLNQEWQIITKIIC